MSKKKRKLKRALKTAALLGAAGLGAAALGRRKQNKTFLAEEGGDRSILPKAKRFVNVAGKMAFPIDVNANPREIRSRIEDMYGFDTNAKNFGFPEPQETGAMMLSGVGDYMPMKKGGRVKKKGFAKKKKQANKMRKK